MCAICAATLVFVSAAVAAWNQPVGGSKPINRSSVGASLDTNLTRIGADLFVAWRETDEDNAEARVSRLNAAGTAWEEVVGGPSPINQTPTRNAFEPQLAGIAGIPHVVWAEFDGVNDELRVSRLNAAGTAWEEVVGGASPINQSPTQHASQTGIADVGGVPYVVWRESDGVNSEVRVSRLNAAGTAWEQVEGGASPINHASDMSADASTIATLSGVPYVAWSEFDGTNNEVRVSRMNGAGTAFDEVVGGASPINQSSTENASQPSLASVGGAPHVAWRESDGTNTEIRVSRLNAAETAWEPVAGGASPINQSSTLDASRPSLADFGGVPYVAWVESDGENDEVRVSRLNVAGTAWEQVVGGPSPINESSAQDADFVSLISVGGVPYVAWVEMDGTNREARVSRLEPDFLAGSETFTDTTAALTADVRTYGVAYPVGFEFGAGSGFGSQAGPVTVRSGNDDSVPATQTISGLARFASYSWRPFGTDLDRTTRIGPTRSFRTTDSVDPRITRLRVRPKTWAVRASLAARRRAKRGTTFRFRLSERARVTFRIQRKTTVRRGGRYVKAGRFAHRGKAGKNRKRFSGRIRGKRLRRGSYRATLVAKDPAGNRSTPKRVKFRVVRR